MQTPTRIARLLVPLAAMLPGRTHAQGLEALEKDIVQTIERVRPAGVLVRIQGRSSHPGERSGWSRRFVERAQLSGTLWDRSGTIVTLGADLTRAHRVFVTFHDGSEFRATIVAEDPSTSIGVLKVEGAKLIAPAWGDSRKLRVGSLVVSVGNPFGMLTAPSVGIVSGLERDVDDLSGLLQVTTPMNPGDTGGPVANVSGEIVGLAASTFRRPAFVPSRSAASVMQFPLPPSVPEAPMLPVPAAPSPGYESLGAEGIGFALPAHRVRPAVEKLLRSPNVRPGREPDGAWLGIQVKSVGSALAAQLDISEDCVLVTGVTQNGPAGRAGIQKFDVLLAIDENPLPSVDHLIEVLGGLEPGTEVKASLRRKGEVIDVKVQLEP